ncbi:MAG: 4Fe-4S double cluster binding domain-containing protein [Eubacteriales bacterium]|nr:4Fe-4S double cluster binding domain-containing protein [Eubacteriales bacterium]
MYEKELTALLESNGVCACGFADVSDSLPEDVPQNLVYAVSFAYKLSGAIIKTIADRPSIMYFQHYRAVNSKLDLIALEVCRFIEDKGCDAFPIAASQSRPDKKYDGVFSHKTAAVRAGLGFIGKNALLINPEYGPGIRLATVLTDMPLEINRIKYENLCGSCDACVKACPAKAISGKAYTPGMEREDFFDAKACSENMKKYNDIGRGAVCGICMSVCPFTKYHKH